MRLSTHTRPSTKWLLNPRRQALAATVHTWKLSQETSCSSRALRAVRSPDPRGQGDSIESCRRCTPPKNLDTSSVASRSHCGSLRPSSAIPAQPGCGISCRRNHSSSRPPWLPASEQPVRSGYGFTDEQESRRMSGWVYRSCRSSSASSTSRPRCHGPHSRPSSTRRYRPECRGSR